MRSLTHGSGGRGRRRSGRFPCDGTSAPTAAHSLPATVQLAAGADQRGHDGAVVRLPPPRPPAKGRVERTHHRPDFRRVECDTAAAHHRRAHRVGRDRAVRAKQVLPRLQHFRTLLGRKPAASLAPTTTTPPTIRYSTVQLYDECLSANASLPKAGDIIARAKAPVLLTADGVVSTGNFSCQDIGRCTRVTTDGNGWCAPAAVPRAAAVGRVRPLSASDRVRLRAQVVVLSATQLCRVHPLRAGLHHARRDSGAQLLDAPALL